MPMTVARENCLALKTSITPSALSVAKALASQYPELQSKVVPLLVDGRVMLQLTSDADPTKILAEGLILGQITTKAVKLVNSCTNSNILQCQVTGLLPDEVGIEGVKAALSPAKVITWETEYYTGTKIHTGVANFLLDISEAPKLPSKLLKVPREKWTETVIFRILGRHVYCHYCRETSHTRLECPHAPACSRCLSRAHPSQRCTASPKQNLTDTTKPTNQSSKGKPGTEAGKETARGTKRHRGETTGEKDVLSESSGDSSVGKVADGPSQEGSTEEGAPAVAGQDLTNSQQTGGTRSGAQASTSRSTNARSGALVGATKHSSKELQLQQAAYTASQARLRQLAAVKAAAKAKMEVDASSDFAESPPQQTESLDKDGDIALDENQIPPIPSTPSPFPSQ
jgi:hypothetical protein